jgi:hypothetical protein
MSAGCSPMMGDLQSAQKLFAAIPCAYSVKWTGKESHPLVSGQFWLSNECMFRSEAMRRQEKLFCWFSMGLLKPNAFSAMREARREYLESAISPITKIYGTVENYLNIRCGIPSRIIDKIAGNFSV